MAETSLILRVCAADGSSSQGFRWPLEVGTSVTCDDWRNTRECGNGLHGWLYGQGDISAANGRPFENGARWLVVEVASAEIVELGGKVKFPRGVVRFVGDRADAAAYLVEHEPRVRDVAVIGRVASVGDGQAVQVGDSGTATAGDSGTATAGAWGTATAGAWGTATAGNSGTATAGHSGTATAGYRGTATAGHSGTATAGAWGTATAGAWGTATAGDSGTATAGDSGTATAGESGVLAIRWFDRKHDRYRMAIAYVGEDGIKANTAYRLDERGKFVAVLPASEAA